MLDYKRGIVKPYLGTGEWDRTKDKRLWALALDGSAILYSQLKRYVRDVMLMPSWQPSFGFSGTLNGGTPYLGIMDATTFALTANALDSTYTYGSAGDAQCARVPLVGAKNFQYVYYLITAYAGTAANVNDILTEIRNDSSDKPGATQHASVSKDPATATGWIQSAPLTGGAVMFAGSANTVYYVVVADPDGNVTDNASVAQRHNLPYFRTDPFYKWGSSVTNGFATTVTPNAGVMAFVVAFDDGTVFGSPFQSQSNSTSSTNKRGLCISDGFTESIKIFGIASAHALAAYNGCSVYEGAAGPEDATAATFTVPFAQTATEHGYVGTPYPVPRETPERFILTYSGVGTSPPKLNIGTGTDANLRKAMLGNGNWYWAEEDQTPNPNTWGNDDINAWPKVALLIEDQVRVAGAAGGMVIHPGMSGGLRG